MFADTRGLATGIIGFFAILLIVALLYTLMAPAMNQVTDSAGDQTTDADAQTAITQSNRIFTLMPVFGLFLSAVFLVARAARESGGPG